MIDFLWFSCQVNIQKTYGGCPKFFLLETAILSRKKFTLAKLSPYSQKTFAGPYVALYLGIFVRKQKLDKGNLRVRATIKTHSVAAAHSRVAFCLYRWSLLTFSGQFWHSHTETKDSPASRLSWKQDITSQQFRPPSFQEKAVFRQALSKLSPNFREKSPYINFIFLKSMYVPVISYYFRQTFAKK